MTYHFYSQTKPKLKTETSILNVFKKSANVVKTLPKDVLISSSSQDYKKTLSGFNLDFFLFIISIVVFFLLALLAFTNTNSKNASAPGEISLRASSGQNKVDTSYNSKLKPVTKNTPEQLPTSSSNNLRYLDIQN